MVWTQCGKPQQSLSSLLCMSQSSPSYALWSTRKTCSQTPTSWPRLHFLSKAFAQVKLLHAQQVRKQSLYSPCALIHLNTFIPVATNCLGSPCRLPFSSSKERIQRDYWAGLTSGLHRRATSRGNTHTHIHFKGVFSEVMSSDFELVAFFLCLSIRKQKRNCIHLLANCEGGRQSWTTSSSCMTRTPTSNAPPPVMTSWGSSAPMNNNWWRFKTPANRSRTQRV